MAQQRTVAPSTAREYAGWLPTITGHLSFGLIGAVDADWPSLNAEEHDTDGQAVRRHLIVNQRRTAHDFIYTGWPVPWIWPGVRAQYLMLACTTEGDRPVLGTDGSITAARDKFGLLEGELLMLPHHDDPVAQSAGTTMVQSLRRRLLEFSDDAPRGMVGADPAALRRDAEALVEQCRKRGVAFASARFKLYRTGEFRLQIVSLPPDSQDPTPATRELRMALQFYYFVKDAAHRHYHHDPRNDNILPLTLVNGDDEAWRRETLWGLARSVLEVRRRNHLIDHRSALGLLAYADAFQATLARIVRTKNGYAQAKGIAPYDFAHTRASLEARLDEIAGRSSGWTVFWTVVITTLLATMALWFAAIDVRDAACGTDAATSLCPIHPLGVAAVRYMINDPIAVFALLGLFVLIYLDFTRDALRLSNRARLFVSSPLSLLRAVGASISRRVRRLGIVHGDSIGRVVALILALGALYCAVWGFASLLQGKFLTPLFQPRVDTTATLPK